MELSYEDLKIKLAAMERELEAARNKQNGPPVCIEGSCSLLDALQHPIFVADRHQNMVMVNSAFNDLLGYRNEDLPPGTPISRVVAGKNREALTEAVAKQHGVGCWEFRSKDGNRIVCEVTVAPSHWQTEPVALVHVHPGGPGRPPLKHGRVSAVPKARLHGLTENIDPLDLLEAAVDPIVVYDMAGKVLYLNPYFTRVFGWKASELMGRRIDFVPDENWPETSAAIDRMMHGENFSYFETRRLTKEGEVLDIQLSSSRFLDRKGRPAGNIVVLRDISERKKMEEALQEKERLWRLLVETMNDGFGIQDADGRITYVNQKIEAMSGLKRKELIGCRLVDFVDAEGRRELENSRDRLRRGDWSRFELELRRRDGRLITIMISPAPLLDKHNRLCGSFAVISDITEQKKREAELESQRRGLQEANTALKVLLQRIGEERGELERQILSNVAELVLPFLEKLKRKIGDRDLDGYLHTVERNLEEITSGFTRSLSAGGAGLTPMEIKVANLIKHGRSTKEIAELLTLSPKTIESHREKIRRKLGIKNRKVNLRSLLLSMD
jgi:PAS domain S-box-containing protein